MLAILRNAGLLCAVLAPLSAAEIVHTLPFRASEVEFDLSRNQIVASHLAAKEVVFVNLSTGERKAVAVSLYPNSVAITPNGRRAYVSELAALPDFRPPTPGKLAEFDLETQTLTREWDLNHSPGDLVATDSGVVAISDFAYTFTPTIQLFNVHSNAITDVRGIAMYAGVTLHPSQLAIYGRGIGNPNGAMRRAAITPEGKFGTITRDLSVAGGSVHVDPSGGLMIDLPFGYAYPLSTNAAEEMKPIGAFERHAQAIGFDPVQTNVVVAAEQDGLAFYRKDDLTAFHRVTVVPTLGVVVAFDSNWVYLATSSELQTTVWRVPNYGIGIDSNLPPVARIAPPAAARAGEPALLSGAPSSDPDQDSGLLYRWDLDGDGRYDTAFSTNSSYEFAFRSAGTNEIGLEVRDRFGLSARAEAAFEVQAVPSLGAIPPASTNGTIPFAITDGVFVPGSPYFFFVSAESNLVGRLNVTNGVFDRQWILPTSPNAIAASRDGRKVFISISTNGAAMDLSDTLGWIGEVDVTRGEYVREFPTRSIPHEIAVTSDGRTVLVHGLLPTFGWEVHSHSAQTGALVSKFTVPGQMARLVVDASDRFVYGTSIEPEPWSWLARFSVENGTSAIADKRMLPGQSNEIYPLADGTNLLTASGKLFRTAEESPELQPIGELPTTPVYPVLEIPDRGVLMTIVPGVGWMQPSRVIYYRSGGTSEMVSQLMSHQPRFLGRFKDRIYSMVTWPAHAVLESRLIPATDPALNLAPSLSVRSAPSTNLILLDTSMTFNVTAGDLDGRAMQTEFVVNDGLVLSTNQESFSVPWTPVESGQYRLEFRTTDNLGARATNALAIHVNAKPTVTLNVPKVQLTSPATFEVLAEGADVDGSIEEISVYYRHTPMDLGHWGPLVLLGRGTTNTLHLQVTNFVSAGGSIIVAIRDNLGATNSTSAPLNIIGLEGDDFRRPFLLSGSKASFETNNSYATTQKDERSRSRSGRSLYWFWTAPTNGIVYVSTAGSGYDTDVEVFLGRAPWSASLGYNDDAMDIAPSSMVKIHATAGTNYLFRVGSLLSNTGPTVIHLELKVGATEVVPPPENDDFADRIALAGTNISIRASNRGATIEAGELAWIRPTNSVWWSWTAPADGIAAIETRGSDFDPRVTVFTEGTDLASATYLTQSDDAVGLESYLQFPVSSNVTYAISLDGVGGVTGSTELNVRLLAPVVAANDHFASRAPLEGSQALGVGSNAGATLEPQEPITHPFPPQPYSVWWTWTATEDSEVWLTGRGMTNSTHQTLGLAVYEGEDLAQLKEVARQRFCTPYLATTKIYASFRAEAGRTYQIRVTSERQFPRVYLALNAVKDNAVETIKAVWLEGGVVKLEAEAKAEIRLEQSTNLRDWRPAAATLEGSIYSVVPGTNAPFRFFRTVR